MASPVVTAVAAGSPAERAGIAIGDELLSIDGVVPIDVIEYHQLSDGANPALVVRRPGAALDRRLVLDKAAGVPVGLEVSSAVFDRVRTCDNHCSFCFIYQLPKGLRRSLYLKDDDYRLSFLYGNFTTLTRLTELDLERIFDEHLSPLFVSIHATEPSTRAAMLRNPRGATSLRWLKALLEGGIEVHGQVVVCPGVNDGPVLEDTLLTLLDEYPGLATVAVVPLGLSRFSHEPEMRPHTRAEAEAVIDLVSAHQRRCRAALGRHGVDCSDEYYLLADRALPSLRHYGRNLSQENGVGMIRTFEAELRRPGSPGTTSAPGFFQAVDGAPAAGYRAVRSTATGATAGSGSVTVLTGEYGATLLPDLLAAIGRPDVEVLGVENRFFGGTTKVAGLLVGEDLRRVLDDLDPERRVLLPDVCLSGDRFLDDATLADLGHVVEVVPTSGAALRRALGLPARRLVGVA